MRIVVASVAFASAVILAAPANADPGKLDTETCATLSTAHTNLIMATAQPAARSAADILEKQNPPDPVKQAIEHFVTTIGLQASDPTAEQQAKVISDWGQQVCP